ncbi:uncharacterized protein LOC125194960 [Salvia hispanica]|uniref:uncharacterized protein LOC125194960 n=1 Tax=Salvia hispanica TaxID=49212 RepID=UPI002009BB65|nr:uncharacterized protein LOC125194960 [Salvia hispanica]
MAAESQALKEKSKYLTWTPEMDKILGASFIEQINQGNKLDGKSAWKSTAWTAAINALRVNLNVKVDKQNIQARLKTWEKHHDILHPVLMSCNSGSPITWDNTTGRIVVHDENVWNERLKANPKIAPYRKRIAVENWDDICALFSQDRADGQGSKTFQENTNEEVDIEVDSATVGESLDMSVEEASAMADLVARKKRKETTSSSSSLGSKKKTSSTKVISDCVQRMSTDFSDYLMVEKNKSELVVEQKKLDIEQKKLLIEEKKLIIEKQKKMNPQEILAELKTIVLDETQLIKALDLMMHDGILFDTFVGIPVELKYRWLKAQLDK